MQGLIWISVAVLLGVCNAAYKVCSYDVCAKGGLWSEWTTTEECATSCGSCSKAFYTRKCLSTNFPNCPCIGDTSRYILCNTQTCAYPAQRTCCIPYVSMMINKTIICGPLPKDNSVSSEAPCCPNGGLWSEWTGYAQYESDKTWKRTRKCLSEEGGCPCADPTNNIQTSTKCPCRDMVEVKKYIAGKHDILPLNVHYNDATCNAYQELEFINNGTVTPCNRAPKGSLLYKHVHTALIRYVTEDMVKSYKPDIAVPYVEHRVIDCNAKGSKRATFYCDLDTLTWRLDYDNGEVYGFGQVDII